DAVERLVEEVAEEDVRRAPQTGAEDAVGEEGAVRHPRRSGDERSDRANESDEAADEDRLAAVPLEEAVDLLQPLVADLHLRAMPFEELTAEPAADEEARAVAGDAARPHDREEGDDPDRAPAGDHSADEHG